MSESKRNIFTKYNSIENAYQKKFVESMLLHAPTGTIWMVQEKIHGANFSIIYDVETKTVSYAKRSGLIGPNEKFYNCQTRYPDWEALMMELVRMIGHRAKESIIVRGELCGGRYDKLPSHVNPVQKGIDYCPTIEFVAFDLQIDGNYVPLNTGIVDMQLAGFNVVRILAMYDTLQEALEHPIDFQSKLGEDEFKMPPHSGDNVTEGVVIKPREAYFLPTGSRAILKHKNEKWKEKASKSRAKKDEGPDLFPDVIDYLMPARYSAVASKLSEDAGIKELGLSMIEDVMEDYLKDHSVPDVTNRKKLRRKVSKLAFPFVKKMLMEQ